MEFTEEPSREPFTAGNAIFHRNWPYSVRINDEEYGDDFDIMPMPYGVEEGGGNFSGTGGTNSALGGWHLTVNPNSDNPSAAVQVLEAFANESVMNTLFREGGWLPPDPSVTEAADESVAGSMAQYIDTMAVAGQNTVPRPVTVVWPDQSPLISGEIHAAYTGDKTADSAMSDLVGQLEDAEQV